MKCIFISCARMEIISTCLIVWLSDRCTETVPKASKVIVGPWKQDCTKLIFKMTKLQILCNMIYLDRFKWQNVINLIQLLYYSYCYNSWNSEVNVLFCFSFDKIYKTTNNCAYEPQIPSIKITNWADLLRKLKFKWIPKIALLRMSEKSMTEFRNF